MARNGVNGVNGHPSVSRPLRAGIFAPIPTFFLPDTEDLGEHDLCNTVIPMLNLCNFRFRII